MTHLACIMDGNRRYAKRLMKKPWTGHRKGKETFEAVLDWCREHPIDELTVYAFSIQNFNRPEHEFQYLMDLFRDKFKDERENHKLRDNGVQVHFLGRLSRFPEDIQDGIRELEDTTKDNTVFRLNFCFGYGGREELVDAIHHIAKRIKNGELQPEEIDEEVIDEEVYNASKPDLIIRTGGEHRTSNFLIWQSPYSEWVFLEKTWPELTIEDLDSIWKDFQARDRRFGR